jgi:hypothetical protein
MKPVMEGDDSIHSINAFKEAIVWLVTKRIVLCPCLNILATSSD